jgi:hypothetical protein
MIQNKYSTNQNQSEQGVEERGTESCIELSALKLGQQFSRDLANNQDGTIYIEKVQWKQWMSQTDRVKSKMKVALLVKCSNVQILDKYLTFQVKREVPS